MTRQEHLQWCKERAIELLDAGDDVEAFASMCSDLNKHDETRDHIGIQLGTMQLFGMGLSGEKLRRWIDGFN